MLKNNNLQLRDGLILDNIALVDNVVRRLQKKLSKIIPKEDMKSIGTLGLIEAATNFNPSLGVSFKCFAERRIKGEIIDSVRDDDALPRKLRKFLNQMNVDIPKLEHQKGSKLSEEDIANNYNLPLNLYHDLKLRLQADKKYPLFESKDNSFDNFLNDAFCSKDCLQTEYEQKLFIEYLSNIIIGLPFRERLIFTLYYYEGLRLNDIGCLLNLHNTRVSQLLTLATNMVKESLYGTK